MGSHPGRGESLNKLQMLVWKPNFINSTRCLRNYSPTLSLTFFLFFSPLSPWPLEVKRCLIVQPLSDCLLAQVYWGFPRRKVNFRKSNNIPRVQIIIILIIIILIISWLPWLTWHSEQVARHTSLNFLATANGSMVSWFITNYDG